MHDKKGSVVTGGPIKSLRRKQGRGDRVRRRRQGYLRASKSRATASDIRALKEGDKVTAMIINVTAEPFDQPFDRPRTTLTRRGDPDDEGDNAGVSTGTTNRALLKAKLDNKTNG
jgi:hypothetical protein